MHIMAVEKIYAVKAREPLLHDPTRKDGVMKYDPTLPIVKLPTEANIWVDILAPHSAGVERFEENAYREFGTEVHGPESDHGTALFQDHALLTLFYPELVEQLGEIMPIYKCQIGVGYFQSPEFREAHPTVSTVGEAQQYVIDRFSAWGQELGMQVTPLAVAPRHPQFSEI